MNTPKSVNKPLPKAVQKSIDQSVLCWLASVDETGMPNVSPKEIFTHDQYHLLIANIASEKTKQNIRAQEKSCVCVLDIFREKGFQLYGKTIYYPTKQAENLGYLNPLKQIAGPNFPILGVFCLLPEKIFPVLAPSYRSMPERTEDDHINAAMLAYGVCARKD